MYFQSLSFDVSSVHLNVGTLTSLDRPQVYSVQAKVMHYSMATIMLS